MFERFIARHAILRDNLALLGYELRFREDASSNGNPPWSAAHLIDASTMVFHWESLTAGHPAFISMDARELQSGAALILPRHKAIIDVPESVPCDADLVCACENAKSAGYRISLSEWTGQKSRRHLLPHADFLRIAIGATNPREIIETTRREPSHKAALIATGVNTWSEHRLARDLGFRAFQGSFFLEPQLFRRREIASTRRNSLRLLQAIMESPLDQAKLEDILRGEPALTYKLLRYLNSPVMERPVEVRSIRTAISLLGEQEFRRWASVVAIVTPATDKAHELLRIGLGRAYFCEQLAMRRNIRHAYDYFFTGLFSVMDAVLDRPMPEILSELALSTEVRSALIGEPSDLQTTLNAAKSYEQGRWSSLQEALDHLSIGESAAPECFQTAEDSVNAILL